MPAGMEYMALATLVEGKDYFIGADGKAHFKDMTYGPVPPVAVESSSKIDAKSVQEAFQNIGDYDNYAGLQCVDLSRWFIDTYTTLNSTTGHGKDIAANTASANNIPAPSSIPQTLSVFSVAAGYKKYGASGGENGHTGIVLYVDEANSEVTVIHTWKGLEGQAQNSQISTYKYPIEGVMFTYLGDYLK
jgi:hypothetical protein